MLFTSVTTFLVVQGLHPYYKYAYTISAFTVSNGPYSELEIVETPEDSKNTYH